jgi:hypothetical protein
MEKNRMTDTTNPTNSSAIKPAGNGEPDALDLIFSPVNPAIPITNIDLTGLGDCKIVIGADGTITSIAKGNGPPVPVTPVSVSRN